METECKTIFTISNPVVRIKRNPVLDEAAVASSLKKDQVNSDSSLNCYLCGKVTPLTSLTQDRNLYLRQITLFGTFLNLNGDDDQVESCADCLQNVISVWDLTQQIETIKQEIEKIVGKVATLRKDCKVWNDCQAEDQAHEDIDEDEDVDETLFVVVKEEIPDENNSDPEPFCETMGTMEGENSKQEETIQNPVNSRKPKRKKKLPRDPLAISDEDEINPEPAPKLRLLKTAKCPHCKKLFSRLNDHIRLKHSSQKCEFCTKSFPTRRELVKHTKWVHTKETFSCSMCSKQLATKRRWAVHETTVCKIPNWSAKKLKSEFNIILATCPVKGCGKQYDSFQRRDMTAHISTHSKSPSRDPLEPEEGLEVKLETQEDCGDSKPKIKGIHIKCPQCAKKMLPDSLRGHIRLVHEGYRAYRCKQCDKSYTTSNNLSKHVEWIHDKKSWSCSACRKKLASRKSRAVHEATVCKVPGWSVDKIKKEFNVTLLLCPFKECERLFEQTRISIFKTHVDSHQKLGVKPNQIFNL